MPVSSALASIKGGKKPLTSKGIRQDYSDTKHINRASTGKIHIGKQQKSTWLFQQKELAIIICNLTPQNFSNPFPSVVYVWAEKAVLPHKK